MSVNKPTLKRPASVKAMQKPARKNASRRPVRQGAMRVLRVAGLVTALLMVSIGYAAGYGFLTGCEYFTTQAIRVEGNEVLAREDVVRASGVQPGDNILAVNLAVVRQRLLAEPWIAEADLYRELPGTLTIHIREHVPMAVVDLGSRFFISDTGVIFKRVEPSDPDTLPVICGLDYSDIDAEGRPASRAFLAALEVLDTGTRVEKFIYGMHVQTIHVDPDTGVTMRAFDTVDEVRLGYDDFVDKFRRLNRVMAHFRKEPGPEHVAVIGLQWPDRIVVAPGSGAAYANHSKKGATCGSRT